MGRSKRDHLIRFVTAVWIALSECTQAMMAISEGRWLADNPPTGMQCVPGNGFSVRALCIEGFNCEEDGRADDR